MADRRIQPIPSVPLCCLMLFVVKAALYVHGFSWTLASIRKRTHLLREHKQATRTEAIAVIERRVALAGALYPGRAACLEQSLVLYYLLRRLTFPARLRLGVQPYPFLAHAWVEDEDGTPVNDVAEHVSWFTPLPDLPS